eukprot:1157283-Pelagomonas_calceolata.AAC.1
MVHSACSCDRASNHALQLCAHSLTPLIDSVSQGLTCKCLPTLKPCKHSLGRETPVKTKQLDVQHHPSSTNCLTPFSEITGGPGQDGAACTSTGAQCALRGCCYSGVPVLHRGADVQLPGAEPKAAGEPPRCGAHS